MGKVFFTKKQKAQMKERRRKKKLQENSDDKNETSNSLDSIGGSETALMSIDTVTKKRPRAEEESNGSVEATKTPTSPSTKECKTNSVGLTTKRIARTLYVWIPSSLASKESKKFRKDARREIRQAKEQKNGSRKYGDADDYDEIEFVTEEDMPSILQPSKKKRKQQKKFPSIKELLEQKHQIEEIQKEESKQKERLNSIPEAVRSKYVALDCEMVGIGTDGKKSALARVSIVDWNLAIVLDTFVQVPMRVTDFRTHVSGVEPKHIKSQNNAMPVKECREKVAKILKGKILVGHALTNDFKALMTSHPKEMIRDTAKYRPFQRYGNGKWRARKLRDLVKENLKGKEGFQEGEHDSVQDAVATMELFQVVFSQWEKDLENKRR